MKSGDKIIVGFWVDSQTTTAWKDVMGRRGTLTERVFMNAQHHFGVDGHTYLSYYNQNKPFSWQPVWAVVQ